MKKRIILSDFWFGFIIGFIVATIIFCFIGGMIYLNKKNKELNVYVEKQIEIETLREDYSNRSVDEFLEDPNIRRAADGAAAEFERKRDEIIQRFRSGIAN